MGEKIQLLLVDDEEEFVNYMSRRLTRHDFEVHAYTHPVEALEKTQGCSFDVALLDLKMPEMDGEELLDRLKQRQPTIEIIILTGHGSIESAFRSAKVGVYEYLLKPCDFDDLVKSLNTAFSKRLKAVGEEEARQVEDLMSHAGGMSPLDLLRRLKGIHHGKGGSAAAREGAAGFEDLLGDEPQKRKD